MITPAAVLDAVTWKIAELVAVNELDDVPRLLDWAEFLDCIHLDRSDDWDYARLPPRSTPRTAIAGRYETPKWVLADADRWAAASPKERAQLPDPDPHRLILTGTWPERQARITWHEDRIRTAANTAVMVLTARRTGFIAHTAEDRAGVLSLAHQQVDHHHAVIAALREGPNRSIPA